MNRIFTMQDQLAFARLSGDFNPMHVDPVAARRLMFGRPVVHGVHALLWAIDALLSQLETSGEGTNPTAIALLKTSFRGPVLVNDSVELRIAPAKGGRWKLDVSIGGSLLASTTLELAAASSSTAIPPSLPEHRFCRDLTAHDLIGSKGTLPLNLHPQLAAELFPTATRLLRHDQLATLLATTRLVGMELPGLHSLFTGLELRATGDMTEPELSYATEEFDDRFSMLRVQVRGANFSGTISAALRPAPITQSTLIGLRAWVKPDEFSNQRALVIGGSRGLGEVVVKELIAGGADVRFSYYKGEDDAKRIVSEVSAAGATTACFAFNASTDAGRLPQLLAGWSPTAFYYFATPYIGSSVAGKFSSRMFTTFCDCYVQDFLAAFNSIRAVAPDLAQVFYPSSATVEDMPPNLVEYFTAKSAGESLCRFLQKANPHLRFMTPRLPRLATDQTASLIPTEIADPAVYMLRLLREMNGDGTKAETDA